MGKWFNKKPKRARESFPREHVIHNVLLTFDLDAGTFTATHLKNRSWTDGEKNEVTKWVIDELRYADWSVNPLEVRDILWQGE